MRRNSAHDAGDAGQTVVPHEPLEVLGVVGPLRVDAARQVLEEPTLAVARPIRPDLRDLGVALALVRRSPHEGHEEDESLRPLGIRRREEGARRRRFGDAEE